MTIDINKLKEGDVIYWNEGKHYFTGNFIKIGPQILDLNSISVEVDGKEIETLDVFLITKEEYDSSLKSKIKPKKDKTEKVVVNKGENYSPKPNLKGIEFLLAKEGLTIHRTDKWYIYKIGKESFEYKGPIKDLFEPTLKGGAKGLLDHVKANSENKPQKIKKIISFEPKANIKGLSFLLEKEGYSFERTKDKWFRYKMEKDGKTFYFDYKGPIKDIFSVLTSKGIKAFLKENQYEGKK